MKILIFFFFSFNVFAQSFGKTNKEHLEYKNIDSLKQSYKSNHSNEIFLKALSIEHSDFVTYQVIGQTFKGNNISAVMITAPNQNEDKMSILFNCAHHANELISTEHCYDIIYQLIKNKTEHNNYLNYIKIWVVPLVNPDGSELFWRKSVSLGRKNGRGVDINRNYPFQWQSGHPTASSGNHDHEMYRGESSASELETQAMMRLAERERFLFSISFHSNANKILYPYTIEKIKNPSDDYPLYFGTQLVKLTKRYKLVKNLYPVDGTDQDYLYFKYGTIAFLLESGLHNPPYKLVEETVDDVNPVWQRIIEEAVNGEKIILKITDEKNNPIEAEIKINDFNYHNNEIFTSNPKNGLYYRMVKERKNYDITISNPDYKTVNNIIMSDNIKINKIVMKKN